MLPKSWTGLQFKKKKDLGLVAYGWENDKQKQEINANVKHRT